MMIFTTPSSCQCSLGIFFVCPYINGPLHLAAARPGSIDWCCFYYFVINSLVILLEDLCAWIFSLDSWISVFSIIFCFVCVCARSPTKPFYFNLHSQSQTSRIHYPRFEYSGTECPPHTFVRVRRCQARRHGVPGTEARSRTQCPDIQDKTFKKKTRGKSGEKGCCRLQSVCRQSTRAARRGRQNWRFCNQRRYEIGTTNEYQCQFPVSEWIIQLVLKPQKLTMIIPRPQRGTLEGLPVATWCREWICSMRGRLGLYIPIVPASLSLPQMRGAGVGRVPTILQNKWVYIRISNFVQSPILSTLITRNPRARSLGHSGNLRAWNGINSPSRWPTEARLYVSDLPCNLTNECHGVLLVSSYSCPLCTRA